jgi:hypothetical protein
MSVHRLSSFLAPVTVAAVLLAGCGSSKPSYCSKVSDLKKSVENLTSVTSVSGLTNQLSTIETKAKDTVNAAKSDFPSETSAVTSSVNALQATVKQLPQSPSAAQIATLTKQAGATVTAVKDLANATSSKCG